MVPLMFSSTAVERPPSVTDYWPCVMVYGVAVGLILLGAMAGVSPFLLSIVGALVAVTGLLFLEAHAIHHGRRSVPDMATYRPRNWKRTKVKLYGLILTLTVLLACYSVSAPYLVQKVYLGITLVPASMVLLLLIAPFVFVETDRRMDNPHDAYWYLGRLAIFKATDVRWDLIRTHALGWLIKGFFLPLMVQAYIQLVFGVSGIINRGFEGGLTDLFLFTFYLIFIFDLLGAVIGYSLTLRLLGTHIRSTNSLITGWFAAIICYPPFNTAIASIGNNIDDFGWIDRAKDQPGVLMILGIFVFFLQACYSLATVNFGLRFSNLTHRGIVTGGLYRWTKHPAYLSKNAFWWVMSIPFMLASGHFWWVALSIAAVNVIYFVRAKTEEQHLLTDPAYQGYVAWIEVHGLFAPLTRLRKRLLAWIRHTPFYDGPYIAPTLR